VRCQPIVGLPKRYFVDWKLTREKDEVCGNRIGQLLQPPTDAHSTQCVGSPNSKPQLMLARRTIVEADMRVGTFRQWVDVCDTHFLPAPTLGQLRDAGHHQPLKRRHMGTSLGIGIHPYCCNAQAQLSFINSVPKADPAQPTWRTATGLAAGAHLAGYSPSWGVPPVP
jgi:hypothetical protein